VNSAFYNTRILTYHLHGIERRVMGATLSYIERVIRVVNMRINVAKWSSESALVVSKIRGAYYYNGFDL